MSDIDVAVSIFAAIFIATCLGRILWTHGRTTMKSTILCKNWDSFHPQAMTCKVTGKPLGVLMPRITQEVLNASPGLQGWSKPLVETRTD